MEKKIPYDQFEEYLNGSLNESELRDFEAHLKSDEAFRHELNLYKNIKEAQSDIGLNDFEAKLKIAEKDYFQPDQQPSKKSSFRKIWMLSAAIFIGLMILAGLNYFNVFGSSLSSDELYAQFAQHKFELQEMSTNTTLGEIQTLLEDDQYSNALPLLNTYLKENPNAADVKLAHAIVLLETQQYDAAISSFKTLGDQHPLYQNEILWYQALTRLKQNQLTECISLLRLIPNSSSRYSEAQQLISSLKNLPR